MRRDIDGRAAQALVVERRRQQVEAEVAVALAKRLIAETSVEHAGLQLAMHLAACEVLGCVEEAKGDYRLLCDDGQLDDVAMQVKRAEAVLLGAGELELLPPNSAVGVW